MLNAFLRVLTSPKARALRIAPRNALNEGDEERDVEVSCCLFEPGHRRVCALIRRIARICHEAAGEGKNGPGIGTDIDTAGWFCSSGGRRGRASRWEIKNKVSNVFITMY